MQHTATTLYLYGDSGSSMGAYTDWQRSGRRRHFVDVGRAGPALRATTTALYRILTFSAGGGGHSARGGGGGRYIRGADCDEDDAIYVTAFTTLQLHAHRTNAIKSLAAGQTAIRKQIFTENPVTINSGVSGTMGKRERAPWGQEKPWVSARLPKCVRGTINIFFKFYFIDLI